MDSSRNRKEARPVNQCRCFLPIEPPEGAQWWRPDLDDDPGHHVRVVARYGEDPEMRRAVRVPDGWAEEGVMVNFYRDITPPMPWQRVGLCWCGTPHPIVAAYRLGNGTWAAECP